MEEFEDGADVELNKPLDIRFAVLGLAMMIFGLPTFVFVENVWIKYFAFCCFLTSFGVIVKKKKESNSP